MGSWLSKDELPKTREGVPLVLLDLSQIQSFQEWLKFLGAIKNGNKKRKRQLQHIHEYTLAMYLFCKAMGHQDDGFMTNRLIDEATRAIKELENSHILDMDNIVTWQGMSVDWLVNEFFEHPYLQEVRKFGCQAWHFRKWGVIEIIRQCQNKDFGSLSGPLATHVLPRCYGQVLLLQPVMMPSSVMAFLHQSFIWSAIPLEWHALHSGLVHPTTEKPTTFISYTGAYTIDQVVEALGLLPPNEIVWMDVFCVDQFAWTGKSRSEKMKEFRDAFVADLQNQIGRIKHTALILIKWDNVMDTLGKMWVLWEVFNTAEANAKISLLLPPDQVSDFLENCMETGEKFRTIQTSLAAIDASNAEAADDGDREAIYKLMKAKGFAKVNESVSAKIRQWEIQQAKKSLDEKRQKPGGPSLSLLNNLGMLYQQQGVSNQARSLLNEVVEKSCTLLGEQHPDTLVYRTNLAGTLERQGQYQEAEQMHRKTLGCLQQVLGENHPQTVASMHNLAVVLETQGQYQEAKELFQKAFNHSQEVLGGKHPDTLVSMTCLADVFESQGQYQEAEKLSQQALNLHMQVFGRQHPATISCMNRLANVFHSQEQYYKAEKLHRKTMKLCQQVLGHEHPETLMSMNDLAADLQRQGQYQEAEALHRQTLRHSQHILGEQHPDTLGSMTNLASVLECQGQYEEAEKLHRQTLQHCQNSLGEQHPTTIASKHNLAIVLENQGQYPEAEKLYQQALEHCQQVWGEQHLKSLESMYKLASLLHGQGQYLKAEILYCQLVKHQQKVFGEQHEGTLTSMGNLAVILYQQQKWEEAEVLVIDLLLHLGDAHEDSDNYKMLLLMIQAREPFDFANSHESIDSD